MVMTDPIADFLTRIRNANTVYQDKLKYRRRGLNKGWQIFLKMKDSSKMWNILRTVSKGSCGCI
jgi:small subunit ribosomal protein S8